MRLDITVAYDPTVEALSEDEMFRIVHTIFYRIGEGKTEAPILDINGNWCGKWSLKP